MNEIENNNKTHPGESLIKLHSAGATGMVAT